VRNGRYFVFFGAFQREAPPNVPLTGYVYGKKWYLKFQQL
jgi:hypothetical protein